VKGIILFKFSNFQGNYGVHEALFVFFDEWVVQRPHVQIFAVEPSHLCHLDNEDPKQVLRYSPAPYSEEVLRSFVASD
jgi:hypothetical protein